MQNNLKYAKYAVVFAGQGAQKPGMGKDLYEAGKAARAVFDKAGEEIKDDCFFADPERLKQTEVTQPAVYTVGMAAFAALMEALGTEKGLFPEPTAVAGFSLGEYAAFTAAGVIGSLEEGLSLVRKRSLLMKEAGTNPDGSQKGTMAAGMGEKNAVLALVEKARGGDILEAVNFNSPQQTVVAGDIIAVDRFVSYAKEDRSLGVKAIPLSVSGAFHSPIMRPAAEGFAKALDGYSFKPPKYKVYLNATGEIFENLDPGSEADKIAKAAMVRQIQSPVLWQKTIEEMKNAGISMIIEAGPGKTLSGLVKKIAPEITALNVEDVESLNNTVSLIKEV